MKSSSQKSHCMYDCQGNINCFENFWAGPSSSILKTIPSPNTSPSPPPAKSISVINTCGPLFNKQKCNPGYICVDGSCTTAYEKEMNQMPTINCGFSGKGISEKTCNFSTTSDKCGPKNDFKRCEVGMYCADDGTCLNKKPQPSNRTTENCKLYSGKGIISCDKKFSKDKCGTRNNNKFCETKKFCHPDGTCKSSAPEMSSDEHDIIMGQCVYSGNGIENCKLSSVKAHPPAKIVHRVPAPAPAKSQAKVVLAPPAAIVNDYVGYTATPKYYMDVPKRYTKGKDYNQYNDKSRLGCVNTCNTNPKCKGFSYQHQKNSDTCNIMYDSGILKSGNKVANVDSVYAIRKI